MLLLFIPLTGFAFSQSDVQDDTVSIFNRCNTDSVTGVVYLSGVYSSILLDNVPSTWQNGELSVNIPTVLAILKLEGTPLEWNKETGFDDSINDRLRPVGWEILVSGETPIIWMQWWTGIDTRNFYVFITDDMAHYVADYGGSNSWHVKCGGWVITFDNNEE